MKLSKPYLIQRASVRSDAAADATVSQAVRLDYMGSSEFEFGALPRSLRSIASKACDNASCLVPVELPGIHDRNGRPLQVVGLPAGSAAEYAALMAPIVADDHGVRLKERADFEAMVTPLDKLPSYHPLHQEPPKGQRRGAKLAEYRARVDESLTRFWWDLNNGVMMSFEPDLMAKLPGHLRASWAVMEPPPSTPALPSQPAHEAEAPGMRM